MNGWKYHDREIQGSLKHVDYTLFDCQCVRVRGM